MEDLSRTHLELIEEISVLKQQNKELKHSEVARKQVERWQYLTAEILGILNDPPGLADAVNGILTAIKRETGFEAIGIRLRNGDDFPYFVQDGFSHDFLLTENTLIVRDPGGAPCRDIDGNYSLECTCGLVISGRTDPTNPLFTPGGSCWTNDSLPLLDLPSSQDPRLHPRNRCIHEGFQSVALIPIRANREIVGLLQLNDLRKNCFTLDIIHYFEGISASIGVALMRERAEEALKESEEALRSLINATNETLLLTDIKGTILVANEVLATRLGKNVREIIGFSLYDYLPPHVAMHRKEQFNKVVLTGKPILFEDEREGKIFEVFAYPVFNERGGVSKIAIFAKDITGRKQAEGEREELILELKAALSHVKTLSGLLPICASCKKIRNDKGYWEQMEVYIRDHSEADFSHGICPECAEKLYPEYYKKK